LSPVLESLTLFVTFQSMSEFKISIDVLTSF